MPYRDRDAESFFAQAAKDPPPSPAARVQELSPIPPSLLRRDPTPPTEEYLQARHELGIPTHAPYIIVACPFCGAGFLQQCVNVATRRQTEPHQARKNAALDASETG